MRKRKPIDRTEKTIDGRFTKKDWCEFNQKSLSTFRKYLKQGKILRVCLPVHKKDGTLRRNRQAFVNTKDIHYALTYFKTK